jgi:peptidoglycan/LPS O-acetylase OafA/YrhL
MISGFVIFMSLNNIKNVNDFLYKRFIRLYPTYWICLIITLLVLSFNTTNYFDFSISEKTLNFLMFHGLFKISNVDGSYWSLIPELLFYALMITLWRLKYAKSMILVSSVWILLMYLALLKPSIIDVFLNLKFGIFFIIGIMFFLIYENRFKENISITSQLKPFIIIFSALVSIIFIKNFEYFIFATFFVVIFFLIVFGKLTVLNKQVFIFLGKVSYPLYLLHQTIGFILIYNLIKMGTPHFLSIIITIPIMILLSFLIYKYFEAPILKKYK